MREEKISIKYNITNERKHLVKHFHTGYEILFVEDGVLHFEINGTPYIFDKNCIIFINSFEKHKAEFLTLPYVRYILIIEYEFANQNIINPIISSILKNRPIGFTNGFKINDKDAEYVKSLLQNCTNEYKENHIFSEYNIITDIVKLLVFLYRNYKNQFPISENNSKIDLVEKINKHIYSNFLNDISLDSIAKDLYLDKYYISHVFKEVTGYSIKKFIILNRLSHAKHLLHRTDLSVTDIAFDSGFNSTSNFIRAFNKDEDMTPLQYRKRFRNN